MNKKLRKLILLCLLLAMALTLVMPAAFAEGEEPGDTTEQVDSNPNPDPPASDPNPDQGSTQPPNQNTGTPQTPDAPVNPNQGTDPDQNTNLNPPSNDQNEPGTGGQENQNDGQQNDSQDENQNQPLVTAQSGESNGENSGTNNGTGDEDRCPNGNPHIWDTGTETKAPTCTEAGTKRYTCQTPGCGKTKDEIINASGHDCDFDNGTVIKASTCTANGIKTAKCKICSETVEQSLPLAKHDPIHVARVDADDCKPGAKEFWYCDTCGRPFADEACTKPANGNDIIIPGNGKHTIPAIEHPAKAPTCTENGNKLYYECSKCNNLFADAACTTAASLTVIPASHNLQLVAAKDATCTEPGTAQHYKCADCGKLFADANGSIETTADAIKTAPMGHLLDWDKAKITQKQTCTAEGISVAACQRKGCSFTLTKTEAALGHQWDLGKVTKVPSCTETGSKTFTCDRCKTTKTEVLPASHVWDESKNVKVDPTCTTEGKTVKVCTVCKQTVTTVIPPSHNWEMVGTTVEPTCTTDGKSEWKCSVDGCKATKTEVIPATGHYVTTWYINDPTCTEEGSKTGECLNDNCPNKGLAGLDGSYVIIKLPALGHQYTAECENKWNHVLTCGRTGCGHKETEPHNYGQWYKVDKNSDSKTVTWRRDCVDCGWAETWTQDVAASPRTGDENNIVVYSLVCALTLCAAGASALLLKRKENG